jgi:phage tail-like protein
VLNGKPDRFGGSVFLRDEAGRDIMRWNFKNGFINEVHGPTLNAGGNEVAVEQVMIVHEELSMELLPPSGGA